jgi:hypothetical protein
VCSGKGSVQTIIPLGSGNGALRLTTARPHLDIFGVRPVVFHAALPSDDAVAAAED